MIIAHLHRRSRFRSLSLPTRRSLLRRRHRHSHRRRHRRRVANSQEFMEFGICGFSENIFIECASKCFRISLRDKRYRSRSLSLPPQPLAWPRSCDPQAQP